MSRIVRLLLVVSALLSGAGTTTVNAAAFTYDAAAVTRVDVGVARGVEACSALPSDARGMFALQPAEAQGGSTTPSAASVATEGVGGRISGGGGSLENLSPAEAARIQNAANKIDQPISVVGSRASGTAGPYSDWDYVVEGANSSTVGQIRNSLPDGVRGIGDPRNLDIFRGTLDTNLPHITFNPVPR